MSENIAVELDISNLENYTERKFLAADADLSDKEQVLKYLDKLANVKIDSSEKLEEFVLNRSEFSAAINQVRAALYIRMTCQTDDPARAKAYTDFMSEVVPVIKPFDDKLDRKYIACRARYTMPSDRYFVYDRGIRSDVELFREENVGLQTEDDMLSQEYQTVSGAMMVTIDGKEYTVQQASKLLHENDRLLREKAWRATAKRRLQDAEKFDEIFDKMIAVRDKMAMNAGFENFRDYQFKCYHRFDYTPDDCKQFHETVEKTVVPVLRSLYKQRQKDMKLKSLRPWDLAVDKLGRPPLKPFNNVGELIKGVNKIFDQVDPELGAQFKEMADKGLLDLASRKGKAPGGYQSTLSEARKPFIFANAVGLNLDLITLLHEGGHAFHAFASADDPISSYRHAPMEFCEVASMSMELLSMPYFEAFYNERDANRAKVDLLQRTVTILPSVATVDKFQHWIYENPSCRAEHRADMWKELDNTYTSNGLDYSGLEKEQAYSWHRILHLFQVPFYYMEYAIAQLGALQVWCAAKKDQSQAVVNYRKALALGGSKPLPDLFEAAGIKFDFTADTIGPLMEQVQAEIDILESAG